MSKLIIPDELKGKELFSFLRENKGVLLAQKKMEIKFADGIRNLTSGYCVDSNGHIVKSIVTKDENPNNIQVSAVINTTNWLDSHKDVHLNGIWKKSLSENKQLYLLQEHQLSFDHIISDQVKGFTQKMTWKSLGQNIDGETEALVFDASVMSKRNPYMFGQYKEGWVKNHSVGMRYIRLEMAVKMDEEDEDARYYKDEIAAWKEVYPLIANKTEADNTSYFFVVREAKVIEGSAVPIGSNVITPTLEVKFDTSAPSPDTHSPSEKFDVLDYISKQNFFI